MVDSQTETNGDRLSSLFAGETEVDEATLGLPDFTDGNVTARLKAYSQEDLEIVQRYAELARIGFLAHVHFLADLASGLHKRDPQRRSAGAVELAIAQVAGSREHFRVLTETDLLPVLIIGKGENDVSDDTYTLGWHLYPTEQDTIWLRNHSGVLGAIADFLIDPDKEVDLEDSLTAMIHAIRHGITEP